MPVYASKFIAYAIMNKTCLLVSLSPSQDRDKFTSADLWLVFDLIRKGRKSTTNSAWTKACIGNTGKQFYVTSNCRAANLTFDDATGIHQTRCL